jgi:hypothetical protein
MQLFVFQRRWQRHYDSRPTTPMPRNTLHTPRHLQLLTSQLLRCLPTIAFVNLFKLLCTTNEDCCSFLRLTLDAMVSVPGEEGAAVEEEAAVLYENDSPDV